MIILPGTKNTMEDLLWMRTERTLVWRLWKALREEAPAAAERVGRDGGRLYRKVKKLANRVYEIVTDIDFTDKGSKAILRIVLVNFIILAVTSVWVYGIMALIIYSAIHNFSPCQNFLSVSFSGQMHL